MKSLNRTLGLLGVCALLGSTAAQAEGFRTGRDCRGSGFGTCAAVQISQAAGRVMIGEKGSSWRDGFEMVHFRTFEFVPSSDEVRRGGGSRDPQTVVNCPVPSGNPNDCAQTTVTPEPLSMTLLATGLAGMALARRKRQRLAK